MALTKSQEQALIALRHFLNDDSAICFSLRGAAGTGKTFVCNDFIKGNQNKAIAVTAPTHKATRVIEQSTKQVGRTIHAMHGLRPDLNMDNLKLSDIEFKSVGEVKLGDYQIVICDEASQIGKTLHNLTVARAKALGVKIIYVGDPYQLPPIKENGLSDALRSQHYFELTEIVRQKEGNELIVILNELRNDIKHANNSIFSALSYYGGTPNFDKKEGISVIKGNKDSVLKHYYPDVQSVLKTRLTAWRRDTVNLYNSRIRKLVFSDVEDLLTKGDILTSHKTMLDANLAPIIINSDDYEVVKVTPRIDEFKIKTFVTTLRNIDTNLEVNVSIIDHSDKSYLESFIPTVKYYYEKAKKEKDKAERIIAWKDYYSFKNDRLTMVDIPILNNEGVVLDTIQKEIDYGYALTTHKLQGTTVDNIIVDISDIREGNQSITFKNKLLYTALSRASKLAIALV